jgi:hypothetical protein
MLMLALAVVASLVVLPVAVAAVVAEEEGMVMVLLG